jgi:hypothetical protein
MRQRKEFLKWTVYIYEYLLRNTELMRALLQLACDFIVNVRQRRQGNVSWLHIHRWRHNWRHCGAWLRTSRLRRSVQSRSWQSGRRLRHDSNAGKGTQYHGKNCEYIWTRTHSIAFVLNDISPDPNDRNSDTPLSAIVCDFTSSIVVIFYLHSVVTSSSSITSYCVCFTSQMRTPLPATELIQTFADVTDAEVYLHFKPKVSLQEG